MYHQPILSLVPLILHPTLSLLALNLHPKRSPGEPWRVSRRVLIVVSLANCDLLGYQKPRLPLSFISRPSAVLGMILRLFFTLLISTITGTSLLLLDTRDQLLESCTICGLSLWVYARLVHSRR